MNLSTRKKNEEVWDVGNVLIKIKFKSLLSIMSRYTLNILKGYKEILDFKLTLNPKGGNL